MASKRLANAFLSNQPRKKMFCNLVSFYHLSNFLVWHCRIVFMLTMTWISLRWILISFLNLSLPTSFQFYEHHPYFLVQMTLLPIHNIILLFAAHPFIHFFLDSVPRICKQLRRLDFSFLSHLIKSWFMVLIWNTTRSILFYKYFFKLCDYFFF